MAEDTAHFDPEYLPTRSGPAYVKVELLTVIALNVVVLEQAGFFRVREVGG